MEHNTDDGNTVNYPSIDESETELCRAIWVSVCVQAVVDARSATKDPKLKTVQADALKWLQAEEEENSDLAEVCSLAGLNFQQTRTRLLDLATKDDRFLDFRCLKKALLCNRGNEPRSTYFKRLRKQERYRNIRRATKDSIQSQAIQQESERAMRGVG